MVIRRFDESAHMKINGDVRPRSVYSDQPRKKAVLIAHRIVREIFEEGKSSGEQLAPEHEMVERFGIGRGTLREALRYLELQGVIRLKPGPKGGPVVAAPDSRHLASTLALLMQFADTPFRAVIEIRQFQEPVAARLAAAKASDEEIAELQDSIATMRASLNNENRFLAENRRFHHLVAWASGNPLLAYLINSLHWITDGAVLGTTYPPEFRKIVLRAHERINDAIAVRDEAGAHEAMKSHMDNTVLYFEKEFPNLLDRKLTWEDFTY